MTAQHHVFPQQCLARHPLFQALFTIFVHRTLFQNVSQLSQVLTTLSYLWAMVVLCSPEQCHDVAEFSSDCLGHFVLIMSPRVPACIFSDPRGSRTDNCSFSQSQDLGKWWHQLSLLMIPPWHPCHCSSYSHPFRFLQRISITPLANPRIWEPLEPSTTLLPRRPTPFLRVQYI